MLSHVRSLDRRMLTRRCVECGYDGALLRGGQAARCAKCGCDLRVRPARSYAEMEGLLGQPMTIDAPMTRRSHQQALIERWLAFAFVSLLMFVAIWLLTAEAFG